MEEVARILLQRNGKRHKAPARHNKTIQSAAMRVTLRWFRLGILFTLAGLALAISAAPRKQQSPPQNPPGPPRNVILPQQLIAGSQATLAVLDANGRLVPGVDLKLSGSGKVTTDGSGRAAFVAPTAPGIFTAEVVENGLTFTTIALPLPHNVPGSDGKDDGPPQVIFPSIISLHDRFGLDGAGFSGDARLNRVLLGALPALVLAASPVSLVAVPDPNTAVGAAKLVVGVNGRSSDPASVSIVSLKVTGPGKALAAGEKSALTIAVEGSRERLMIEVRNSSPEVVSLPRGNIQRVTTSGGESNAARIELEGVTPGDYSVSAHIVSGTAIMTGVETARQRLLAALQFADAKWLARIDRVIEHMDRDPQNVAQIRREVERLMRDRPQAQVGDLLKLAWQALGGE